MIPDAPTGAGILRDPCYSSLKEHIIAATGLAYYRDRDEDLARRLAGRMTESVSSSCAAYLALLQHPLVGEAELDELIKELTIGETFFFRHTELFEALRTNILPQAITRNREHHRLRIWSAGCATGAEPYSLAILLYRDLGHLFEGGIDTWDITILGTDINRDFLAHAQEGSFSEWALRTTSEEIRQSCFCRQGNCWVLLPRYRDAVCFQYHNLVTHPFPSLLNNLFAFDLILCRNVMIYFGPDIVRRLLANFRLSLVEDGHLLVGHAEPNVDLYKGFRTLNVPGAVFYQKSSSQESGVRSQESGVRSQGPVPRTPALEKKKAASPPASGAAGARRSGGKSTRSPQEPVLDLAAVRALADQGEGEQALAGCRALLRSERLNPLVHFYHGLVLEQIGRHAEAEDALRKALYLDRRFTLAHYYLGLLLQKRHEPRRAVLSFRNALDLLGELDPNHVFTDGDGITAVELARLTQMHLKILAEGGTT
jgi:chemotaxis protein methyltransferase CheR